jgi:uridine kinase
VEVTVIGVAGGTGSGKSTLVEKLLNAFGGGGSAHGGIHGEIIHGESVAMLAHDSYYKAHNDMTFAERSHLNYDHPGAFDTAMMVEHLRALKSGVPVDQPVYSFVDHNRTAETVLVKPSRVVIVDGILIFENEALREQMDIKVYVDTDADVRLARRIMRDVRERGRSMESVINQYLGTVKPMHEEFVEPSKRWADVIIPEGGFNSVAVAMLIENIKSLIRSSDEF